MKESLSLTNNLLKEVEVLSNRLRNIKQSYKTTENKALKGRLISENKNIFKRVNEIYKIAELLNKIDFSLLKNLEIIAKYISNKISSSI